MAQAANATYSTVQKLLRWPGGLWLFSKLVCLKAPYFGTIRPRFTTIEPGRAQATLRKRWRVTNHIGTVHAIAMANLCEYVGGTLMEVSIPPTMRWIPKGMNIEYLAKANTDLTASCQIDDWQWDQAQDVHLNVLVYDQNNELVARAEIPMYVSPRKART